MHSTKAAVDTAVDTVVSSAATTAMGGGATTSLFGWITSNHSIAVMGLMVAILGFSVNLYFQLRRDRREQELHQSNLDKNRGI
jgi:fucose permease